VWHAYLSAVAVEEKTPIDLTMCGVLIMVLYVTLVREKLTGWLALLLIEVPHQIRVRMHLSSPLGNGAKVCKKCQRSPKTAGERRSERAWSVLASAWFAHWQIVPRLLRVLLPHDPPLVRIVLGNPALLQKKLVWLKPSISR